VAGFNDSEGALMDPPLTSVIEFPEELGKHLADFVLRRVQQPDRALQQLTIPTRLVLRGSTKRIPHGPALVPASASARLASEV
jgi:LacI family transcriptional regulator